MSEDYQKSSLQGCFLISEANMQDPNFHQTVVLMIDHNEEGAFGLVVNRKSSLVLADVLPEKNEEERAINCPLYIGGPVQQEYIFAVHSQSCLEPSATAVEISPDVYFEPGFKQVLPFFDTGYWNSIPADDRPDIHVFLGYSGWGPGQLEAEMEAGSWMTIQATRDIIFHENPEEGWKAALRKKGGIYKIFADSNQDPSLN